MVHIVVLEKRYNQLVTQLDNVKELSSIEYVEVSTLENVISSCKNADIVVINATNLPEEFFESLPLLKMVMKWGVGVNNIDLKSASKHGVIVCNCPHYGDLEIAEYALLLTLTSLRKFNIVNKQMLSEGWVDFGEHIGRSLRGLTVGVLGVGRIGKNYINMLRAFGVKVVAYSPNSVLDKNDYPYVTMVKTIDDVLKVSDVISLHMNLNDDTHNILNANNLLHLKDGAIVVNVSRGALVDDEAMLEVLESGKCGGYAVDVFVKEPLLKNHFYFNNDKVLLSPHYAFVTEQCINRTDIEALKGIESFIKGQKLVSCVNIRQLEEQGFKVSAYTHGEIPYDINNY